MKNYDLVPVETTPYAEQSPFNQYFKPAAYSCASSANCSFAPLCNCSDGCMDSNTCCPDACKECGTGSAVAPIGSTCGVFGSFEAKWNKQSYVGLAESIAQSCVSCVASAVANLANTHCGDECDPCSSLDSAFGALGPSPVCDQPIEGSSVVGCVQPCPAMTFITPQCYDGTCEQPNLILP